MQAVGSKKKYKIDDYVNSKSNPIIKTYTPEDHILSCICGSPCKEGQTCFNCKAFVHKCLAADKNREEVYECASCLNKNLDPLFQVVKVLNEGYCRTMSIFKYSNIINYEFIINPEDRQPDHFIEVRSIHPGTVVLGWPMQGGFAINDEKSNFHEIKPLLINSNRKARR